MNNIYPTDPTSLPMLPNEKTPLEKCVRVIAIGLIIIGATIIFYSLKELYLAYRNIEGNGFFTTTTNFFTNKSFMSSVNGELTMSNIIGEGGAKVISLIFLFLFTMTAASMGRSLLKLGVDILPSKTIKSKKDKFQSEDGIGSLINQAIIYSQEKSDKKNNPLHEMEDNPFSLEQSAQQKNEENHIPSNKY